ncbi:hypothetical protein D3C76_1807060 [compost metagenome]
MDKWQEQQLEMRELKAETKTEVIQVPVSRGIDPKELEEVILRLETNVRQLKDKLPRVEEFL